MGVSLISRLDQGTHFNRAQRELVTKLSESLTVDNKPASPGLMEKMKDLFN